MAADFVDPETLRAGAAAPIAPPDWIAAEYLEQDPAPGDAAARLLAAAQAGQHDVRTTAAILAEIERYLALDPYGRARYIADARWQGWGHERYNTYWLERAAAMLGDGDLAGAERALRHLRKPWSDAVAARRYSLWGQLYLRQANYAHAAVALEKQARMAGDGLFDHYNFAYALLQIGDRERALAVLDDIGLLAVETEDHRALRDRANLALGWYWLAQDQGGTARAFFRRVRLEGPFSNLSLLGLGWAELAADGQRQHARFKRRVLCEKPEVPPDALMRLLSDRYAACRPGELPGVFDITHDFAFDTAAHGTGRYLEALRPWRELARRDVQDPAVQEALLAMGYAHEKRGAPAEAEQAYRAAVARFETETARLTALASALRDPAQDPLQALARHARPREFATLRSSREVTRLLELYDALRQVEARVAGAGPSVPAELQDRLTRLNAETAAVRSSVDAELRRRLLDELGARRTRLDHYHSRARLALAQLYDRKARP
ncbi:MAG TPA: hypothetical protein VNJ47_07650 [Nevskiales bacterium]|nr:hypothetical protein [Nevskiales bacterium]